MVNKARFKLRIFIDRLELFDLFSKTSNRKNGRNWIAEEIFWIKICISVIYKSNKFLITGHLRSENQIVSKIIDILLLKSLTPYFGATPLQPLKSDISKQIRQANPKAIVWNWRICEELTALCWTDGFCELKRSGPCGEVTSWTDWCAELKGTLLWGSTSWFRKSGSRSSKPLAGAHAKLKNT